MQYFISKDSILLSLLVFLGLVTFVFITPVTIISLVPVLDYKVPRSVLGYTQSVQPNPYATPSVKVIGAHSHHFPAFNFSLSELLLLAGVVKPGFTQSATDVFVLVSVLSLLKGQRGLGSEMLMLWLGFRASEQEVLTVRFCCIGESRFWDSGSVGMKGFLSSVPGDKVLFLQCGQTCSASTCSYILF